MAEKSKKDKARAKQTAPPTPEEHSTDESLKEQKPVKKKSEQPKDDVGTRKGCRRYRWELKDSNKEFWVMGHAEVKILSLGCLTAAMVMFTGTAVHPILTLIITMEISIFSFFFFVHTFAVQRYMPFILWPVSELLNDLFSTIFLAGAVFFAVKSRKTMPMNYFIAVILISLAGFFALIDICLQRNHFRGKRIKKNVLVPPEKQQPAKDAEAAKPKEKPTTVKAVGKPSTVKTVGKPSTAKAVGKPPIVKPKEKKGDKK